jgi:hypothetical protein
MWTGSYSFFNIIEDIGFYCNHPLLKTIFPNGFDQKEHDMIEVDSLKNPVKDELK